MKQPVEHLVLMGVAGCGKTTAAINLHNALGWPVAEADDFHSEVNIAKMSRNILFFCVDVLAAVFFVSRKGKYCTPSRSR